MIPLPVGETAVLDIVVLPAHTVDFDKLGKVHPVYATYAMAKHFEEAGRKLLPHTWSPARRASARRSRSSTSPPAGWATNSA
jgi:fluoroacetyl-CoA thioesterase